MIANRVSTRPREMIPLEKNIVDAIVAYLKANKWETMIIRETFAPGRKTSEPGIPDIWAAKNGRALWLEVKRPKVGILSEEQEARHQRMQEQGIEVYVVCGVDDVISVIQSKRVEVQRWKTSKKNRV